MPKPSNLISKTEDALDKAVMEPVANGSTAVSTAIHDAIRFAPYPIRKIADFLHGTWLGHPLHPVLTDLTIGAWLLGGLFDGLAWITGSKDAEKTADQMTLIGTVSAVPTAITGMIDYSTFPEASAKPVTLHAITNILNFGLYIASVRERRRGNRARGVAYSTIGLALTSFSSWLGGELVYRYRVGVDHTDDFEGPKRWTAILAVNQLPQRKLVKAEYKGKGITLYREGPRISAFGEKCSHAGGPLHSGTVKDGCVTCPWHHSVFSMPTGKIVHGPATRPQPSFEVRVADGQIQVRVKE